MWRELLINFLPEILGILITIFFVDKVIQKREDARWLPSRQFLYSRLVTHFDNVMRVTVPFIMSGSKYIYEFGNAVVTTVDVRIDFENQEIKEEVYSKIRKYSREITLNDKLEILKTLSLEKDAIDKILAGSVVPLDPELASDLMKLQRVLSDAEHFISTLHIDGGLTHIGVDSSVDVVSLFMYNSAESAQNAKAWVIDKATNKTSTEEFSIGMNKIVQQQENSRRKNG